MTLRPASALLTLLIASLPALFPVPASAWGRDGHRIVGHLAATELNPQARAEVARLLAGESEPTLAGVSDWADTLRDSDAARGKATAPWHYINFSHRSCRFDPPLDCRNGDCVVGAINRNFLILSDHRRPLAERRDALKFLVHFVGDVHQPLHASPRNDKGGNEFQVNLAGRGSNLHKVWDRSLIERRALAPDAHAAALRREPVLPRDPTLASTTPALDWALESCRIVDQSDTYPRKRVIDDAYLEVHLVTAERRLREAGSRLAALLNHALRD